MKDILFLVHRIPYPPDKGDKIRSWHLLRFLAERYRVHLGCFVDDPADRAHLPVLEPLCASIAALDLSPRAARIRSLRGLVSGEALSFPYYRDARMHRWVAERHAGAALQCAVVFSSAMAQFLSSAQGVPRTVIDMVDVDSEKWRQYGETTRGPMGWIYRREGRRLLESERAMACDANAVVFVSPDEARLFRDLCPEAGDRVVSVRNGVDLEFFDPAAAGASPFPDGEIPLVFTGAMDYRANVDAVTWFVNEVLPGVRERFAGAVFTIVGSRPDPAVRALGERPGVRVTGRVEDVRPWIHHARVSVAPLRIARGLQNKVLEAMALDRPVVATSAALEGIGSGPLPGVTAADAPSEMTAAIAAVLSRPASPSGGRAFIRRNYSWDSNLERFGRLVDGDTATLARSEDGLAARSEGA